MVQVYTCRWRQSVASEHNLVMRGDIKCHVILFIICPMPGRPIIGVGQLGPSGLRNLT